MKFYIYVAGIMFLFAMGIVMLINANVGLPPWDMFHIALSERTGLTIGMSAILTSLICLLIANLFKVKPGIITLMDAILIGLFVDLIMFIGFIPEQTTMLYGLIQLMGGLIVVSFCIANIYYINMSFGPRDGIVIALSKKLNLGRGVSKFIIELVVFILAFFMGGPFGVGTVIVAVSVGAFIGLWLKLISLACDNTWGRFLICRVLNSPLDSQSTQCSSRE